MYEEGIIAQSDVGHRYACSSDIFLKTWVCVLSEYISFTEFNVSLDTYLHTLYACGYISYNSVRWLNSQNNKTVIPLVAHI